MQFLAAKTRSGRAPARGGRVAAFNRMRRIDADAARVLGIVAAALDVPQPLLLHTSRCTADVAEARQLAMYLMHVVLQRKYADIGQIFGRDRTTVSHACGHIEDRRDEREFEEQVLRLEAAIRGEVAEASEGIRHAG